MRLQLFEFGDLSFPPKVYHEFLRSFMGLLYRKLKIHHLWIEPLNNFIKNDNNMLHDPCAGSGEVNLYIKNEMNKAKLEFKFILSDIMTDTVPLFAKTINNLKDENIYYIEQSVNLLDFQNNENYSKVFINSFHHFTPSQVSKILEEHFKIKKDIIVLEYCQRSLMSFLSMIAGPLLSLILFPFIIKRKHFFSAFVFVYLLPIIPLMLLWDGIISSLRTYTKKDLQKLMKQLQISDYKIIESRKRSLLYPSGVTAVQIIF